MGKFATSQSVGGLLHRHPALMVRALDCDPSATLGDGGVDGFQDADVA